MMEEADRSLKQLCRKWFGQYPRLVAIGGLGIVFMMVAPILDRQDEITESLPVPTVGQSEIDDTVWENKLSLILSSIEGVGAVEVVVRTDREQTEYEKNRTSDRRSIAEGGNTTVEEKTVEEVAMQRENGTERPIVKRTIPPHITGIVVTAEGAASSAVRVRIREAVCAATGVGVHRITVLSKKGEKKDK